MLWVEPFLNLFVRKLCLQSESLSMTAKIVLLIVVVVFEFAVCAFNPNRWLRCKRLRGKTGGDIIVF